MQVAVIEYARHICGMDDANSTESDSYVPPLSSASRKNRKH